MKARISGNKKTEKKSAERTDKLEGVQSIHERVVIINDMMSYINNLYEKVVNNEYVCSAKGEDSFNVFNFEKRVSSVKYGGDVRLKNELSVLFRCLVYISNILWSVKGDKNMRELKKVPCILSNIITEHVSSNEDLEGEVIMLSDDISLMIAEYIFSLYGKKSDYIINTNIMISMDIAACVSYLYRVNSKMALEITDYLFNMYIKCSCTAKEDSLYSINMYKIAVFLALPYDEIKFKCRVNKEIEEVIKGVDDDEINGVLTSGVDYAVIGDKIRAYKEKYSREINKINSLLYNVNIYNLCKDGVDWEQIESAHKRKRFIEICAIYREDREKSENEYYNQILNADALELCQTFTSCRSFWNISMAFLLKSRKKAKEIKSLKYDINKYKCDVQEEKTKRRAAIKEISRYKKELAELKDRYDNEMKRDTVIINKDEELVDNINELRNKLERAKSRIIKLESDIYDRDRDRKKIEELNEKVTFYEWLDNFYSEEKNDEELSESDYELAKKIRGYIMMPEYANAVKIKEMLPACKIDFIPCNSVIQIDANLNKDVYICCGVGRAHSNTYNFRNKFEVVKDKVVYCNNDGWKSIVYALVRKYKELYCGYVPGGM